MKFPRVFENLNKLVIRDLFDLFLDILVEGLIHYSNHSRNRRFLNFTLFHQKVVWVIRVTRQVDDDHRNYDKKAEKSSEYKELIFLLKQPRRQSDVKALAENRPIRVTKVHPILELFLIGESLVSLSNLEPFCRSFLLLVLWQLSSFVRVILPSELSVGFLHLRSIKRRLKIDGWHFQP